MTRIIQLHRATPACVGFCDQGRLPCDSELCNAVELRAEFPSPAEKDPDLRATVWSVYAAGVLLAVVALILACWPK